MTTPEQEQNQSNMPTEKDAEPHEVYLENADVDSIHGEIVHAHQSTIDHIVTDEADLENSHAEFIDAQKITAHQSIIGKAHAETIEMEGGDTGVIYSENANLSGNLGAIFSQAVTMNQSQAGVIVAREMKGDKIQAVILVAAKVNGPVETKLDTRNALLVGAIAGAIIGIFISIIRFTTRR